MRWMMVAAGGVGLVAAVGTVAALLAGRRPARLPLSQTWAGVAMYCGLALDGLAALLRPHGGGGALRDVGSSLLLVGCAVSAVFMWRRHQARRQRRRSRGRATRTAASAVRQGRDADG